MKNPNDTVCPQCAGLGATTWLPDASPVGGYWESCRRCGGLRVIPQPYTAVPDLPLTPDEPTETGPGLSPTQIQLVAAALAALSQPATLPADVAFAKARLREVLAHAAAPDSGRTT